MHLLDWLVLALTILSIVLYGIWKSRSAQKTIDGYLLAREMNWTTVGLSVMATQASAITFLSGPGQAFTDGMRFIQLYFGMPLAMIIIAHYLVPAYHKAKIYTAYEFLEKRFDSRVRIIGAALFLFQRGIAAGITIYAPSLIISNLLDWNIYLTNTIIGAIVVFYTVLGGSKAVSITQKHQMVIILIGIALAAAIIVSLLPEQVGIGESMMIAGKVGKFNLVDTSFSLEEKYNLWSGLLGGMFLAFSYFGTDQSQVQRYLSGKSIEASRMGLLMNGFLKIPFQFFVLFVGILLFSLFQFIQQPINFNDHLLKQIHQSNKAQEFALLETDFEQLTKNRKIAALQWIDATQHNDPLSEHKAQTWLEWEKKCQEKRKEAITWATNNQFQGANDTNYIFLNFVKKWLPIGLVGLLIAVIVFASMSSISSELSALGITSLVDIYKNKIHTKASEKHYLRAAKLFCLGWGIFAIILAQLAHGMSSSLIELVNQFGSLFYGTILGIFMVAFFLKRVSGVPVTIAAICAQTGIFLMFAFVENVSYLWYNVIGALAVCVLGFIFELFMEKRK